MKKDLSLVVAVAQNGAIGKDNQLLIHIPGDLPRFKALTTGGTVVMGRKTFESLPKGALPNRRNIVISRSKGLKFEGCEVVHSVHEVLDVISENERVYVIGGGQVYTQFLPHISKVYLTVIDGFAPSADTFFHLPQGSDFMMVSEEVVTPTEKFAYTVRYQLWQRINIK